MSGIVLPGLPLILKGSEVDPVSPRFRFQAAACLCRVWSRGAFNITGVQACAGLMYSVRFITLGVHDWMAGLSPSAVERLTVMLVGLWGDESWPCGMCDAGGLVGEYGACA